MNETMVTELPSAIMRRRYQVTLEGQVSDTSVTLVTGMLLEAWATYNPGVYVRAKIRNEKCVVIVVKVYSLNLSMLFI